MKNSKKHLHTPYVKFEYDKRLVGKATDVRIYRDVTILTEGTFSDSLSMEAVQYPKDVLKRTVSNWQSNYLNIDHSHRVLDRIGKVENARWGDGKVKADLYIHPITENATDTIKLIDSGLINWLSVEIMTEDAYDRNNERYVKDLDYIGLAVVTAPACKGALIHDEGPEPPGFLYD